MVASLPAPKTLSVRLKPFGLTLSLVLATLFYEHSLSITGTRAGCADVITQE